MSIYNWLAIYITSIAKKIAFVFLLFNAALQVVKHTSWIPGSSENYICYSHTLSFGLKCQKEFSCCLVWWKKSLEFYRAWCVHRRKPKLHCCIVKVCWLFFIIGCCTCWAAFNPKIRNFRPILGKQHLTESKSANWSISGMHQWVPW